MSKRGRDAVSPKPPSLVRWPTTARDLTNPELHKSSEPQLTEEQEVHTPYQAPQPLATALERWDPKHLGLKNEGFHVQDMQRAAGNWDTALKGLTHLQQPSSKAPRLYVKEIHLLILEVLPERPGPVETQSWSCRFGALPLPLLVGRCNPSTLLLPWQKTSRRRTPPDTLHCLNKAGRHALASLSWCLPKAGRCAPAQRSPSASLKLAHAVHTGDALRSPGSGGQGPSFIL